MKLQYEITVEGRVQGVGFRYFVRTKAQEMKLKGFTRNTSAGEVMVVAEGEQTELDTLVDYMRMGPPLARVRNIAVSKSPFTGQFDSFTIKY
jgi:acylphosphatase